MIVLFIELAMHVVRCYNAWCTQVPSNELFQLQQVRLVELVFEIPLVIKIWAYRLKETAQKEDEE